MTRKFRDLLGRLRPILVVAVLASGPFAPLTTTAAQEGLRFDRKGFACVMENVQAYINADTNPVVIFIKFCPKTGVTQDMLRSIQRNASPELPGGSNATLEPVISFTKDELSCLADKWRSGFFDAPAEENVVVVADVCGL